MKRRILVFSLFIVSALAVVVPAAATPASAGPVSITLDFPWIRQGQVGLVHVTGPDLVEVRAVFQERIFYFYPDNGGFTGLISANITDDVGVYIMQVWVKYADETAERVDEEVEVNYGEFGSSEVTISPSLMPLLEPEINEAEEKKLFNIFKRFTPERYWEGGFVLPSGNEQIGFFGAWRLYNGTYWYQHTGLDIRMPIGTSVIATASGQVILSEMMAIRGGYVLIDHGWGVFSGYAHLSERFVVPGQWVKQGEVIGLSGMNGRSSGAHLHWEIIVGGEWVSPESILTLGLDVTAN